MLVGVLVAACEKDALRPDLIYVSISGFGSTGPSASRRVYDSVIQAMAGMAGLQAPGGTEPQMVRTVLADKVTAQTAAQAITAALLERERSGQGQHVHVSMLHAMVAWLWPDGMSNHTFVDDAGVHRTGGVSEASLVYRTSDGFIMACAVSDLEWRALCRAIGRPELGDDPRFSTMPERIRHTRAMRAILVEAFLTRTTQEWNEQLAGEDAVSAPIYAPGDVIDDPQVVAGNVLFESDHPVAGRIRQPEHPVTFERTPAVASNRHAPTLGEHTDAILGELGVDPVEIARLRGSGVIA